MNLFPGTPISDFLKMAGGTLFGAMLVVGVLRIDSPALLKAQAVENTVATTLAETKKTEEKKLLWEAMTFETLEKLSSLAEEDRKFDYPLAQNQNGKDIFVVPQNACRNGVRVEARAEIGVGNRFEGNLQVVGVDRNISRTVLNTSIEFSSENPFQVVHLPASFLYQADDGTVFPKYSFIPGRNADKIVYDVWCY